MNAEIESILTETSIVKMLVRMRLRMAERRHGNHFYWSISDNPGIKAPDAQECIWEVGMHVDQCVPSRREWPRPPRRMRNALTQSVAQAKALTAMMKARLKDAAYTAPWKANFRKLYLEIENRLRREDLHFDRPTLHLKAKSNGDYRCLGTYARLSDRLIQGLFARHMRSVFDGQMRENSYAFRNDREITHTTAIKKLRAYRMAHEGETLYVAECDIRSFFDVVNHDVVIGAYDSFAANPIVEPHGLCRKVIKAYLDSYSSFRNVAESETLSKPQRSKIAFYNSNDLLKDLRKFYGRVDLRSLKVGIPQGGMLSPLLINMVMHSADDAVLSGADQDLFYARFCDDIIIVHKDRAKCKEALDRYLAMLHSLMLPHHPVQRGLRYGRDYYAEKSKGPIAWCDCRIGTLRATPWVSFLGEQVRFDGSLRVRESSLDNERRRILKERSSMEKALGSHGAYLKPWLDRDKIYETFRNRIVALGVGYAQPELMGSSSDRCWMAAFPGLADDRWCRTQMKVLDRTRDRVLVAVKHKCIAVPGGVTSQKDIYLGRPYSYLAYLRRSKRPPKHVFNDVRHVYG